MQVQDSARGEVDPGYATLYEKWSYVNDEPERSIKTLHVHNFSDRMQEWWSWGEKEKEYHAIIGTFQEWLKNFSLEKEI